MKNIFTKLMTTAAFLVTLGGALEAQTVAIKATVPFAWQVAGQTRSAGEYTIVHEANAPVIAVRNVATGASSFFMVGPGSDKNSAPRLVFHTNGEQYFLSAVYMPGMTARLMAGKAEKETISSATQQKTVTILADVRIAAK